jgi:hypothetical protein
LLSKGYISDPMLIPGLSCNLMVSGHNDVKGKGKAIAKYEEDGDSLSPQKEKRSLSPYYETDSEDDEQTRKAIALSLQEGKIGESSKTKQYDGNSPVQSETYDTLTNYTHQWKISNDMFLKNAKLYNSLKIKLDKQTVNSEQDVKLLSEYLKKSNEFKLKKNLFEKKLLENEIDPSYQFNNESCSDMDSNSSYSSYNSKSSNNSEYRSNKRVKFDKSDFSLCFISFNIGQILRTFSCLFSAILLLVIHFNLLPNIDLCFIKIDISQLLFIYLVVNFFKLIYKCYSVFITLFNHYLNKDYITIYFNIYFSIVIVLLYFSSNIDISIFYI